MLVKMDSPDPFFDLQVQMVFPYPEQKYHFHSISFQASLVLTSLELIKIVEKLVYYLVPEPPPFST